MGTRKRRKKSVKGSRRQVWNGSKAKTNGSMTKSDLMMNKRGKVVSKKAHALGKRRYKKNGLSKWTKAFVQARKKLGIKGFKPCKKGTKLYKETRKLYNNM